MPRYKLTLAYDGTNFSGWQKQEPPRADDGTGHPKSDPTLEAAEGRTALRTVQAVVERAVREVVREPAIVMGASRTDAGVHANGQVAAFTCSDGTGPDNRGQGWPADRGLDKLRMVLNAKLPRDVLVRNVEEVPGTFDPIGDCTAKAYSYTINPSRERSLWDRDRVLHLKHELDTDAVQRMHEAAQLFVGEHDFNAFAAAGHGRLTTVRTVFDCRVFSLPSQREGLGEGLPSPVSTLSTSPLPSSCAAATELPSPPEPTPGPSLWEGGRRVRIEISGNGFLYNMVRIIAGTLVEVGKGKMTLEDVRTAIESRDRVNAGPTLPPEGLCLEWVRYGHH